MTDSTGVGPAWRFLAAIAAWSVAAFALVRMPFVESRLLMPLTTFQANVATWYTGAEALPVTVTISCSGGDVLALLLAVTFAYPVRWARRLAGAAVGTILILAINTVRIGTLGALSSTRFFIPMHLYGWPAILVIVTVAYTGAWIWLTDDALRRRRVDLHDWRLRFAILAVICTIAFAAASPWLLQSAMLVTAARYIASFAAGVLGAAGIEAALSGAVLTTKHGSFLVTPECITTPLMPVYLAAAATMPLSMKSRVGMLVGFVPIFALLTTIRLFTLALPAALVASPLFVTHGFHQIVLAVLAVSVAAWASSRFGSRRGSAAVVVAAISLLTGAGLAALAGRDYTAFVLQAARLAGGWLTDAQIVLAQPGDTQGALATLPAFQLSLLVALWLAVFGWRAPRRFAVGFGLLALSQMALLAAAGELWAQVHLELPVTALRAWAVIGPLLLTCLLAWIGRSDSRLPQGGQRPMTPRPAV